MSQYTVQWKMLNNSEIIFVIGKAQSAGIAEAIVSICNAVCRKKEPELTTIFQWKMY